ncbi:MAG: hypothetical protein J6J42_06240 [Lachnospiraceae bacterium]|nr:hypothetical protein [Lachnospiraceae bacterium]
MNKKKEYYEFLLEIAERVEQKYAGLVRGEVVTSVRNNNVPVTGLVLKKKKERVAPNFYLERQFIDWMCGKQTMEEIADRLCRAYEEEMQHSIHLVSEIQFSWEDFRRRVFMRLINRDKNQQLLQDVPYREFMDLAIIYYYSVPISEETAGTMIVTEEHLKMLQVSVDELHQAAESNCQRFQPVQIRDIRDVMQKLGSKLGTTVPELSQEEFVSMYVMSNTKGMYGAVSMVFQEELHRFSERLKRNFYLLPSSIHEVILIPEHKEFCQEYFSYMVREINRTQVETTEVLSDSIYYYDRRLAELRRVG